MRHSLQWKTILLIVLVAVALSAVSTFVGVRAVSEILRNNYENDATALARTAAAVVDSDALKRLQERTALIYDATPEGERASLAEEGSEVFAAYTDQFEELVREDDFGKVHHQLRQIQDTNRLERAYTVYVDEAARQVVYLVDASINDACPIGSIDALFGTEHRVLEDPTVGFPVFTGEQADGSHIATAGAPVFDKNGTVVGYALVDISVDDVIAWRHKMISIMLILQVILTGIVCVLAAVLVSRTVVRPIRQLSDAAADYRQEEDVTNHGCFAALDIQTGDEIQELSEAMKQMEVDLNEKIASLLHTTDELTRTRIEADKLNVLAMKDAMTGVQNKRAYDVAISELTEQLAKGKTQFGFVVIDLNGLKQVNDNFGHEMGDISIQRLCHMICGVFDHSPVYRIGGDEFTVILQGEDYDHIEDLIAECNAAIRADDEDPALQPWERMSAAIGYALFDQETDTAVNDTFRRADRAMYRRKEAMKRERAGDVRYGGQL